MMRATIAVLLALATTAHGREVVPVTECGQLVPARTIGELQHDLTCEQRIFGPDAVVLAGGATLRLRGFSITGLGERVRVGVSCVPQGSLEPQRCSIKGPGEISGFWAGVNGGLRRVHLADLTVRGNTHGMVLTLVRRVVVRGVRAVLNDEAGIWATNLRAIDVDASHNGGPGVAAFRLRARRLTAIGNGGAGVSVGGFDRTGGGRLRHARLEDNDGLRQGYDLLAYARVRRRKTTCGSGANLRATREGGIETTVLLETFTCPSASRPSVESSTTPQTAKRKCTMSPSWMT